MALFRRKKIEKPKSPLGSALYKYDDILKKDLKRVLDRINTKGKLNPVRASIVIEGAVGKFDVILNDLSRENLKIDYRSDKIRYLIIDMINGLKTFFSEAKALDYDPVKMEENKKLAGMSEVVKIREIIKGKMKDIESDYL